MNAVIYARYSSDNQREESIDGQIRECMEYCSRNGMTVIKEYIDRALSAKTDQRPDFQRMIKDSAKGLFDVVVVWKLDRFARNRYDSAHYKAVLKKNSVRVVSAKENIADGPEGIILESMLEGMAEYYSAELSVKVIRGHTENALKCKYNGGTPTFGFRIDADKQYQPDPITAPIVLDIFKMYDTGSTMKEIVDHLNGLGVTTVRGKVADLNFISGILHNRKYIGEYKYRNIVVPDGIPALVPMDLFERVQSQMQKNKKAPARHKAEDDYLLTTKLFCGSCKAMMVGESGRSSSKGRVYHYYRCVNSKKKKICTAKHRSVRKEPLERAVVDSVMRNIMDDAFVEYFTDQALALQGQESSELPALRRQLADTEKAINNLLNAIQAGAFNASVKRRLDEMEETKEKLELSIVKEEMKRPQFTREQIQFYILQFRKVDINTLEGRRRLIDSFVNSVVVYDDSILVTFNYKEGAERITFDQIEGLEEGADAYICKPFNTEYLLLVIKNLLGIVRNVRMCYLTPNAGAAPAEQEEFIDARDRRFMDSLTSYLERELSNQNLDMDMIAEELCVSRSVLYRRIKSLTGLPPNDCVRDYRLKRAVELMGAGETLAEVAERCGFSSYSYFSKSFKQHFGMSPKEYLKSGKRD